MKWAVRKWLTARAYLTARRLFEADWYRAQRGEHPYADALGFADYMRGPIHLMPCRLFDASWYLHKNPDVRSNKVHPFIHYLIYGWKEERDPHPFFDANWYARQVGPLDVPPIEDFMARIEEGHVVPHPLFDSFEWNSNHKTKSKAYYEFVGSLRTLAVRSPHPLIDLQPADGGGKFYGDWRDAFRPGFRPALHILFDHAWYLKSNRDVAESGFDPLLHFVMYGDKEGRSPNRMFDTPWYKAEYKLECDATALSDYIRRGAVLGYKPCPVFDPIAYAADVENQGLSVSVESALQHYLQNERKPSALAAASSADSKAGRFPFILEITYDETISPKDLGESDDARQICVGFKSLAIRDCQSTRILASIGFSSEQNATQHILFGIAQLEGWGAWSLGSRTVLLFWLEEIPNGPISVHIDAVLHSALEEVALSIVASNGYETISNFKGPSVFNLTRSDRTLSTQKRISDLFLHRQILKKKPVAAPERLHPRVSIIILNFNRAQLSILSAISVINSVPNLPYEIIIADNGSIDSEINVLENSDIGFRIVKIGTNRFFGEGNNIAFEESFGEYVLFLNNDAFLTKGLIDDFVSVFERDATVGAVGPNFRYLDGAPQEVGAFVRLDGHAYQRGKYDPVSLAGLADVEVCDYVSAACLMIKRKDFLRVGGFSFRYDPAYYEDTDLCFKLLLIGKHVVVATQSICYHIEHATTSDPKRHSGSNKAVMSNKIAFLGVWRSYLSSRAEIDLPVSYIPFSRPNSERLVRSIAQGAPAVRAEASEAPRSAVYTPYPLNIGGGERYILSCASVLAETSSCEFVTPNRYSYIRLSNVAHELGVDVERVVTRSLSCLPSQKIDVGIVMGNDIFPPLALPAQRNYFHCQFPFPPARHMTSEEIESGVRRLKAFRGMVVNSEFTRDAILSILADHRISLPVAVCYPSVDVGPLLKRAAEPKERLIVSVGRISDHGHNKRQDIIIEAFKNMRPSLRNSWRLVLCGPVAANCSPGYLEKLQSLAIGFPIEFKLSPPRAEIADLLRQASVYVHAAGFGVTTKDKHHLCEHFGISVVEAIASGCQCYAYAVGGPVEIFRLCGTGRLFWTLEQLTQMLETSDGALVPFEVRLRAAKMFDHQAFRTSLKKALS